MLLILTLTCLGLVLIRAENAHHVSTKMTSFASSHLPDHYTFEYEMDDGTSHREEGRLVDGVWVVVSQFSCFGDDSPIESFSFVGNKCRREATPLGLTDKMGEGFMESAELHGQPFQSRYAVPFNNDTEDVPLRIGLPITPNELNFLKPINKTADVSNTSTKTDVISHFLEVDTRKEGNTTTDGRPAYGYNQTNQKLHILEISDKGNLINKSDIYTDEIGSPESSTPNKIEDSVLSTDHNRSMQGETSEIPTKDRKTINSESANTKTESEKSQVSINAPSEGQENHFRRHPIIKRVQISRHLENPDIGVNVSNITELRLDLDQPISDDQLTGDNRSYNFQVFFKKARNMTMDSESHNLFLSSDDMNKGSFYNNSRSFLEAFLKTDTVPYSINTEAVPNNINVSPADAYYTTPLPELKVVEPV